MILISFFMSENYDEIQKPNSHTIQFIQLKHIQNKRMQSERKLILIFKSFIEKALIPQIKRMEGSLFEWNKFNAMITNQTLNYTELQGYVDSLGPLPNSPVTFERKELPKFQKKRQDDQQNVSIGGGFNPSKTFGGDRVRMMFPIKNDNQESSNGKQWSFNSLANRNKDDLHNRSQSNATTSPQILLPGIERLAKMFGQTQSKLESMLDSISGLNTGPYTSEFALNKPSY